MAEPISTPGNGLRQEIEALRAKLAEAERKAIEAETKLAEAQDVIRAIQAGDVDAVVVSSPEGDQVFTLKGAEYAYRALVEAMNEGAATLGADGTVLYCNRRLADLLEIPMEQVIGNPAAKLIAAEARYVFEALFAQARAGDPCNAESFLQTGEGNRIPVYLSLRQMKAVEPAALCMVVTDLTERNQQDEIIAAGRLATSILESVAEAIAVCDAGGKIITVNAALEALCGCNPLFQPFDVALPLEISRSEPGVPVQQFSISAALNGVVSRVQEVAFRRKDGQVFSLLLSAGRIVGESGVVGCVLTLTDISARKQAEEARREAQAFTQSTIDALSEHICVLDEAGTIVSVNRAWREFAEANRIVVPDEKFQSGLHRSDNSFVGANYLSICDKVVGPDSGEATGIAAGIRAILKGQRERFSMEYACHSPEEQRWFICRASRFLYQHCFRVVIEHVNITERKKAEEALRTSETRLRLALAAANAGAWEWDLRTNANTWSDELWKVYGLEPHSCEASYETWLQTVHPADRARAAQTVQAAARQEKELAVEWRRRDGGGQDHWLMSRGQPVRDADGVVERYIGIVLDITERKRIEEALIRSEKLASVGRMAATIAHEINNPLETVGHAVYLALTDSGTSQQAKSYLDLATQELERVTHVTRQTLSFHRESKTPALVDLRESIDAILKLFAPRLKARGIAIEKRYAEIERIKATGPEIQQIISNLLSNSMDATPNGGRILLRLSPSTGKQSRPVRFTIADTGSGIPPEAMSKMFEPFFTTKEMVGTGLGLWVTKQIVDKHGATIRVRSKPGRGTVFSICFPVAIKG